MGTDAVARDAAGGPGRHWTAHFAYSSVLLAPASHPQRGANAVDRARGRCRSPNVIGTNAGRPKRVKLQSAMLTCLVLGGCSLWTPQKPTELSGVTQQLL